MNGSCTALGCVCDASYGGADCSELTCPAYCGNGTCDKATGKCKCRAGYTGATCAFKAGPEDCSGRGTCVDGTCVCEKDVSFGEACQHLFCPRNCSNHGMCLEEGKCKCRADWRSAHNHGGWDGFGYRDPPAYARMVLNAFDQAWEQEDTLMLRWQMGSHLFE